MLVPYIASPCTDVVNPPVPPNIAYFLDHGLRDTGRWFVPLILRLPSEVTGDDVRAVLTAVANHHDALRLEIIERAGAWEEHIAPPREFARLSTLSLAPGASGDDTTKQDAVLEILAELVADQEPLSTPLVAAYIPAVGAEHAQLALAVHHLAGDDESLQIVTADIMDALGQRLAGDDIVLQPATMTWCEWSQRCAALATHPAVLDSRDVWLDTSASPTLRVADHDSADRPHAADLARHCAPLSEIVTMELDEAALSLGLPTEEMLLATLGRTIARTIGEGVVAIDLIGDGRLVLAAYVDLHRTVGWFSTIYPVPVTCVTDRKATATEMLGSVHRKLAAVPHQGIGRGLLQYFYAPTALHFAARPPSDVLFSYADTPGAGTAGGSTDGSAMAVRETLPGLGHALELRAYHADGVLQLDWWYDARRMEESTVEELAEQFPLALIELTSEAIAPVEEAAEIELAKSRFAMAGSSRLGIA